MRALPLVLTLLLGLGCRFRDGGLTADAASPGRPLDSGVDVAAAVDEDIDAGEPPGVIDEPSRVGCSDGSREGFRDLDIWQSIAGCAGAFDQPGVVGGTGNGRTCNSAAGDTGSNALGIGCSAADLCALGWHVCRSGADVAAHSPSSDCEGCVPAGERRFFVAAVGASSMGLCTSDSQAANDLHGCGGLGEPEDATCAPFARRMGFADCLAGDAWWCGTQADSLREARVVRKTKSTLGGVLCCRGD